MIKLVLYKFILTKQKLDIKPAFKILKENWMNAKTNLFLFKSIGIVA